MKGVRTRGYEWAWIHVRWGPKDIIELMKDRGIIYYGILTGLFK